MKRVLNIFHLLPGIAFVAVIACTKVEPMPAVDQEIAFAVGTYAQTKAEAVDVVDGITTFRSKAFLHANGAATGTDYFGAAGTDISKSGTTWEPVRPYYWPLSAETWINFVSWYDNLGTPTTATETVLSWENRSITATDNILYADEAWRFHGNLSNTYFTTGVPTLFHHALAQVAFTAKAEPLTDPDHSNVTWEVTVNTASISSIYSQGTLRLTNSDPATTGPVTRPWNAQAGSMLWTPSGSPAALAVGSNLALTASAQPLLAMRSVLPQTLGNTVILTLEYTVTCKSSGTVTSTETATRHIVMNTLKNSSNIPITEWAPNKKYTYNISINPVIGAIYLNPNVSDWSNAYASVVVE